MTYASQQNLTDRYGEKMLIDLTDREQPYTGAIVVAVVTQALSDTDAMINGYLLGRYQLPLASTPDLLRDLAEVIAIYKLHRDAASDKIRTDYQDALKTLSGIASGTIRLNIAGVEPPASGASGVQTTDRERPLTPESLRGFI